MSLTLGIRLLGGFSLTYGDRTVTKIASSRSQALLAYLLLHRQSAQSRQRIAFDLWPDSTDAQARTNLRKELSYLRRDLPEADRFLLVEAKTLQWLPTAPFTLDVLEFQESIKAAGQTTARLDQARSHLDLALQLYRGDLLPSCEDEWLVAERERLAQMRVRALEESIEVLQKQQDYRTAIGCAQQLLRIDPLNEATYASLMQLHGLSGDRANALQVYYQCMTMLREELGVDPSLTTRNLYQSLLNDDEPPSLQDSYQIQIERQLSIEATEVVAATQMQPESVPSDWRATALVQPVTEQSIPLPPLPPVTTNNSLPLVGRDRELHVLQDWLTATPETGTAEILLLLGEPGIGKTRLLEELATAVRAQNGQVLWGCGFEAEMLRPYGAWIDAIRSFPQQSLADLPLELRSLFPEVSVQPEAPADRCRLFDAVVRLLSQRSGDRSLTVAIFDNIQWLDEASTALLHYAARLLGRTTVRFACAARPRELERDLPVSKLVSALRRDRRLQTLELPLLEQPQIVELIRAVDGAIDGDRVFAESGGNPLLALEIARAISQYGTNCTVCSDSLEALIQDRLQQLDRSTRELLLWAAALGRSFDPTTIAQIADCPIHQLLMAIEELEQEGIVRPAAAIEGEMQYDFVHDIVRQVAYNQLSTARRRLVHLQIAQTLKKSFAADGSLASDIAYHASLGGDRALAASTALAAAERCLKLFAYAEALELAEQGIQHSQFLEPQTRISYHAGFLRVCVFAGVTGERAARLETEIQQLLSEAKSLGLNEAEAIALEALTILQFDRGNFTSVHQHSLQAAASQFASPATAARMLALSGSCLAEIGREMARAEALLLEAQSLAARVGLEMGDIFGGLGCVRRHRGDYTEARSHLQQGWQAIRAQKDHWREFSYLSYLAMTELEAGEPMAALTYCDEMSVVAAKIQGEGSEAAVASALKTLARYGLELPNTEAKLTEAIATLQQLDAKRMLSYVLTGAAEIDLSRARTQLAVDRAEAALKNARIVNHPSEIALSWAILIQGLLALGERQKAMAQLELLRQTIEHYDLSFSAQSAIERAIEQTQAVTPAMCQPLE
ncbi:ATP-binding protein [Merismopedia glauca]|uniref:ATP-binding protein n=1 Tax=Merismopedia glauca TaxID=292586 RepID=UPI0015E6EE16|nr:BTAD domain-containing putative transcriptional regulator [Merismopedia glauca]